MRNVLRAADGYLRAAGGSQVFSTSFFFATLGISYVIHFTGTPEHSIASTWWRLIVVLVAHLSAITFLWLVSLVAKRWFSELGARRLLASMLAFAAFVRTAIIQILLEVSGADSLAEIQFRLISGTLLTALAFYIVAIVTGLISEHAKEFALLRADENHLRELLSETRERVSSESQDSANVIKAELMNLLGSDLDMSSQQLSAHLRTVVDDGVRPLIRRILDSTPDAPKVADEPLAEKFQWGAVFGSLKFRDALSYTPMVISVVALIPWDNRFGSITFAALSAVLKIFALLLAVNVGRFFAGLLDRKPSRWNAVLLLPFMAALTIPYDIYLLIWNPYNSGVTMVTQGLAYVMLMGFLYATWESVVAELDRTQKLRRVNNDRIRWQIAHLNGLTWATKRSLARQLHGAVQSEIISVLLRIARDEQSGTGATKSAKQLQVDLRKRLELILDTDVQTHDFAAVMSEITETWGALTAISFEMAPDALQASVADPLAAETTIEIIREAVSNAVRHGQASQIEVAVSLLPASDCILATVTSVGKAFEPSSREGLGTQQLRDCTVFYSMSTAGDRTVVSAAVPFKSGG